MDAAEVEMRYGQCDGVNEIVELAQKARRQPRESFVEIAQ